MFAYQQFFTMKTTNIVLIFLILLMLCANEGAAIKCFVCDSSDNPSCADLKSNSSIVAEDCTLDKMRSIDSWLFALNRFDYFDTGANKAPLMNCQKVVARNPNTHKMVTARFCQLDTGDSDACAILKNKLHIPADDAYTQQQNDNNAWRNKQIEESANEEQKFHCSICTSDHCNGAESIFNPINYVASTAAAAIVTFVLMVFQRTYMQRC